jgi:hypothetical protein
MEWRPFDPERDRKAAQRIWYETGWLRPERTQGFEAITSAGRAIVADVDGGPECLVLTTPGSLRYQDRELPFTGVTAVTTSRVGRRQGLAGRLTARAVALDAEAGAEVAGLGMFDQGYYDRLGFGSGGYEHRLGIDPMALDVDKAPRRPVRLGPEDWEEIHAARRERPRRHGGLSFDNPSLTRAQTANPEHAFGLGYRSGGRLTHHLWCHPDSDGRNQGPYHVPWLCYRGRDDLLELLALLKDLGDQVLLVSIHEPPGIQLQDFIRRPFRLYAQTRGAKFEMRNDARAFWQMRVCDLPRCVAAASVPAEVRFNLELSDPIERYLDAKDGWRGVGGNWTVRFGPVSEARPGAEPGLPTLQADVGAFTRLWLGVLPATGLEAAGKLSGPGELLARLDASLTLPQPKPDWDF